ncbi:MAG: acetyl-CoA C-acyltransferase [Sulfobacillus benefaciens]|uniref:acetyl-CoA C-acetyltransferase n=1 Tax=Sulfobacillus benefaciens TaxID=453960 RepID=A0A2T2XBY9_9FIRM|nr:MAG: acetyl-CoA C-acyltransferase [Sulfobacillus benefaciens]
MINDDVVVVSACRTAQGNFGGSLRDVPAATLAATVMREAIRRAGISADQVDTAIMGQVYQTSEALNIARFSVLQEGLPVTIPGFSVQMACCSGLEAVNLGVQEIRNQGAEVVLVGGVENMSRVPYLVNGHRWGAKRGHGELVDMLEESSWSASSSRYGQLNMGLAAEHIATQYGITREAQDQFALTSHQRAIAAKTRGYYRPEIVPVDIPHGTKTHSFAEDEHPREDASLESLGRLRPSFLATGTVTAGNASSLSDGAAALILMSGRMASRLHVANMARIVGTARVGVHPLDLCMSPAPAAKKALERANVPIRKVDLWEINEAFAAVVLASAHELEVPLDMIDVNGGGIAMGHPVGCSGARILVSLVHEMQRRSAVTGVATVGGGGGVAVATVVQRN